MSYWRFAPQPLLLVSRLGRGWKRLLLSWSTYHFQNTRVTFLKPGHCGTRKLAGIGWQGRVGTAPWDWHPWLYLPCPLLSWLCISEGIPGHTGGARPSCQAPMPDARMCFSSSSRGSGGRSSVGHVELTPLLAPSQASPPALLQNFCLRTG